MGREHPLYRLNLELLNTRFPDYDMLTVEEAMAFTRCKSRNTFLKRMEGYYDRRTRKISKAAIALWMCGA